MDAALKMNSKCYSNEVLEYMIDQAVRTLNTGGDLVISGYQREGLVPELSEENK